MPKRIAYQKLTLHNIKLVVPVCGQARELTCPTCGGSLSVTFRAHNPTAQCFTDEAGNVFINPEQGLNYALQLSIPDTGHCWHCDKYHQLYELAEQQRKGAVDADN